MHINCLEYKKGKASFSTLNIAEYIYLSQSQRKHESYMYGCEKLNYISMKMHNSKLCILQNEHP